MSAITGVPEQGQLVVRQWRCAVTDVGRSTLPISPLDLIHRPKPLVSRVSTQDDALSVQRAP
jgi:hypothetical protein